MIVNSEHHKRCVELLRSASMIARRKGKEVNWTAFQKQVEKVLQDEPAPDEKEADKKLLKSMASELCAESMQWRTQCHALLETFLARLEKAVLLCRKVDGDDPAAERTAVLPLESTVDCHRYSLVSLNLVHTAERVSRHMAVADDGQLLFLRGLDIKAQLQVLEEAAKALVKRMQQLADKVP